MGQQTVPQRRVSREPFVTGGAVLSPSVYCPSARPAGPSSSLSWALPPRVVPPPLAPSLLPPLPPSPRAHTLHPPSPPPIPPRIQNATDELERLEKAFDIVKRQLFSRLHNLARRQIFPEPPAASSSALPAASSASSSDGVDGKQQQRQLPPPHPPPQLLPGAGAGGEMSMAGVAGAGAPGSNGAVLGAPPEGPGSMMKTIDV